MNIEHATSRTRVARDHALITPESHVPAPLVGWTSASAITLIAPRMGAGFAMHLVTLEAGGASGPPPDGVERFVYVLDGTVHLDADRLLGGDGYAYFPPGATHRLHTEAAARLLMVEKVYRPLAGCSPRVVVGHEADVEGEPFLGDPDAILRPLLPDEPGFDFAMNSFAFQPGATLPLVESHVMEHGLIFLQGGGVYRLGDDWYPVTEGDAIWMGPYLPQWFGCLGKGPAKYLYYKDVHRDVLTETPTP